MSKQKASLALGDSRATGSSGSLVLSYPNLSGWLQTIVTPKTPPSVNILSFTNSWEERGAQAAGWVNPV